MKKQVRRPIIIKEGVAYVPLTKGYTAVIDAEDVGLIEQHNWYAAEERRKDGTLEVVYARRNGRLPSGKRITVLMHKCIKNLPEFNIDHKDCNGLNNRKNNLRPATRSQNMHNQGLRINNKTGFKGVTFYAPNKKFLAKITVRREQKHLGYFDTKEEAAKSYAEASKKYHGEFGRLG